MIEMTGGRRLCEAGCLRYFFVKQNWSDQNHKEKHKKIGHAVNGKAIKIQIKWYC